jgi:hypothetical protein
MAHASEGGGEGNDEVLTPNQTIYINNLNERIKKEGKLIERV